MMLYSSGVRVVELLNLKPSDILSDCKLVFVKGGKGMKDMHTILSQKALATQLLESGADIRIIQALPGHASSKTTEICTHIPKKHPGSIINPFNGLDV
ncbi:MAG: tyrosine-type recombinase/integrase [Bacteroidota bacterium]|nr:tyrosine-type recombinase/integrase [Bacteroidota bacterium]